VVLAAALTLTWLGPVRASAEPAPLQVPDQHLSVAYWHELYDAQLQVVGGTAPYHFDIVHIAPGFLLGSSGEVTGLPLLPADATISFTVTDATGATTGVTYVRVPVTVDPALQPIEGGLYAPPCQVQEIVGGALGYGSTPPRCF